MLSLNSLRRKVNAAILVTALLIAAVFMAVFPLVHQERLKEAERKARTHLALLANRDRERLANEIFEGRMSAVRLRIKEMLAAGELARVGVYGMDGELLASDGLDLEPVLETAQREQVRGGALYRTAMRNASSVLDYLGAIKAFGETVGYLSMTYSLASVEWERVRLIWLFSGLLLIVFASLLVFLNYILERAITRPVRTLAQTMETVAEGELGARIAADSADEVGNLGRTFNRMAERIERQQASIRQAEEKYRAIFVNANEGLFQLSRERVFLSANPAMARILGYGSPEELMRSGAFAPHELYEDLDGRAQLLEELDVKGMVSGFETRFRRRDGSVFWGGLSVRLVKDLSGGFLYYEGSLMDVTDRKEREHVERERRAAENLARTKGEFLARMSHEIRTPINAILGMAHLAGAAEADPDKRRYLDNILTAGRSLLGIINEILDFSKIEAGKLVLENAVFTVDDVLNNLAVIICPSAEEKGLRIVFQEDPALPAELVGDALRLGQILINLAGNAVKFTDQGEVAVSVSLAEQVGRTALLRFSVADTGAGFSPEEAQGLFDEYSQADASIGRKFGGTGLGLSISNDLVKLMGGEIKVSSIPGRGSDFSFVARFALPERDATPAPSLTGKAILVADGGFSTRRSLAVSIEASGGRAAMAANAAETLERLALAVREERPFDAALIAHDLPGADASALYSRIKTNPAYANLRIVALVPFFGPSGGMPGVEASHALCVRPATRKTLLVALREAFDRREERGAAAETADASFRGARVLVVEDNEINRQVAEGLLRSMGVETVAAGDGPAALEALARERFDLVFMDIQMPGIDGLETVRRIRSDHRFETLPVVAMTALSLPEEREAIFAAGMDDHLAKPVNPASIQAMLQRWLPCELPAPGMNAVFPERSAKGSIDYAEALDRLGGQESEYKDLLGLLRASSMKKLEIVEAALASGELESARYAAHYIRGSAGNLGAGKLAEAAQNLENAIKEGGVPQAERVFPAFKQAIHDMLADLDANFPESTEPGVAPNENR